MTENRISIVIPDEVYTAAVQKLNEVQTLLQPYLIALTPEERKGLPKMGDRTFPFVKKSYDHAKDNSPLLPVFIEINEWQKDVTANAQLSELGKLSRRITDGLDDTMMLTGSEGYTAALGFYNNVKQAAKMNVPGAKTVLEDLQQRFPGRPAAQSTSTNGDKTEAGK